MIPGVQLRWFAHGRRERERVRALVRETLANLLHVDPSALRLERGAFGKPALGAETPLYFSVSYTDDVAVLALCEESPIGIDIAEVSDVPQLDAIARTTFAPEQFAAFDRLRGAERLWRFYELWTALEASVKLDGRGLGQTPPDVCRFHTIAVGTLVLSIALPPIVARTSVP